MEPMASQPLSPRQAAHHQLVLAPHSGSRACADRLRRLIAMPRYVIKLESIELVLQLAEFLVVCSHLGVVAAPLLHDLVNDQLGVTPDVEASDTELNGNAQAIDERFIFGYIVRGGEMEANHVPDAHPKG